MATRKSTTRKPQTQREFWNLTARDIFGPLMRLMFEVCRLWAAS
jgi:hypothetical protein